MVLLPSPFHDNFIKRVLKLVQPALVVGFTVYLIFHNIHFVLCNAEPLGSKAPNIGYEMKWKMMIARETSTVVLFCTAQAFPIPTFRWVMVKILEQLYWILSWNIITEPLGSKAPNVGDEMKWRTMVKQELSTTVMFCSAQAYPIPTFRCDVQCCVLVNWQTQWSKSL